MLSQLSAATRQSAQTIVVNYITIIYCLPVIQITVTLIEYDFLLLSLPDLKGKLMSRAKPILIKFYVTTGSITRVMRFDVKIVAHAISS